MHPGLIHRPTLPPAPRAPTPAVQQWGDWALFLCLTPPGLIHIFPNNRRAARSHLPPEGCLACHKASPLKVCAAPAPACSKQKPMECWGADGQRAAMSSSCGLCHTTTWPGHHAGWAELQVGPGGAARRTRQRAFRVLRSHPEAPRAWLTRHGHTGHQWAPDHSAVTASGRDPSPWP